MTRPGKHTPGIIIFWTILVFSACGGSSGGDGSDGSDDGQNPATTRSFHLGFTPFPHDITQDAIDYNENGASRPALDVWQDTLDKKHVAATIN